MRKGIDLPFVILESYLTNVEGSLERKGQGIFTTPKNHPFNDFVDLGQKNINSVAHKNFASQKIHDIFSNFLHKLDLLKNRNKFIILRTENNIVKINSRASLHFLTPLFTSPRPSLVCLPHLQHGLHLPFLPLLVFFHGQGCNFLASYYCHLFPYLIF